MSTWGDLLGGGGGGVGAESFFVWAVLYSLVQSVLQPVLTDLTQLLNAAAIDAGVHQVLTPAELASMVVKNLIDPGSAAGVAAASGIDGNDFTLMIEDAGEPPGLETVLEMWRRGYVPWADGGPEVASVERAILTSRIYDYWAPAIQQMGQVPISPADTVEATLKGQRPQTDMETEAYASGIDAERFQILLDTAGDPLAPGELRELLNRKLIPLAGVGPTETSFQQGIYEGRQKDKWWQLSAALAEYIPPPRSIATLQSHGVIDEATAAGLYQDSGLTPELAATYAQSATSIRVATHTQLTEANILKLYSDGLATADQATAMLEQLSIPAPVIAYLLELQDFNEAARAYEAAVNRVGTLYLGRHITRPSAVAALGQLDVPAAAQQRLMQIWDEQLVVDIPKLTVAEVTDAYEYQIMDVPTALGKLGALGYAPYDAWVILSDKNKGALPGGPPAGTGPGGVESPA